MKAVRVHVFGGPEALVHEDVPVPEPGPGEALVQIAASGINFIDVQHRAGRYKLPGMPVTIGSEAAGTVSAVGAGVTEVTVGDRVAYAMVVGSYADYAVVPASRLVPLPAGVDFQSAAAVMLQGMTAHYLTHSTFPLKPGDVAVVHAAAGGAQDVIVYTRQDFEAEVKRITSGRGADVVYDSVGKDTFDKSLNCLRARGYLALFGFSSGPVAPFDPAVLGMKGSLFLTRPGLNQYIATRDELLMRAQDLFRWIGAGELRLRIDRVLPLAEAAQAHRALEARQTSGKVLLATS